MNNVSLYFDYFRQLAIRHAELQHNPASETGDAPAGSQHFIKCGVEEVLKGLRSKVGFPCLILELYETELDAPIIYDIKENPAGAFMVMDHPADKTFAAETACHVRTEAIVRDLLRQIYQDHYAPGVDRCKTPFKEFLFDHLSVTPVGPIFNGEFGYRVVFGFQLHKTFDITLPPAPGRFITPAYLINDNTAYLIDENDNKIPVG